MNLFRKKSTNYGKIVAVSIAVAAVASAVAFVVYKLIKKYTEDVVYDCDDLLEDENNEGDVAIEDAAEATEATDAE